MTLNIPTNGDYENTLNRVRVSVYVQINNVWILVPKSALWLGGQVLLDGVVNPPPVLDVPILGPLTPNADGTSSPLYDMRGNRIRVELDVQRALKVGVSVSVTP